MRPRFELDGGTSLSARPSPVLIDPEAYDASEQRFAASLEESAHSRARFVVDDGTTELPAASEAAVGSAQITAARVLSNQTKAGSVARDVSQSQPSGCDEHKDEDRGKDSEWRSASAHAADSGQVTSAQAEAFPARVAAPWRQELAARLNNYRARRRPREPRYPSLQLKFEASDPAENCHTIATEPRVTTVATRQSIAVEAANDETAAPRVDADHPASYGAAVSTAEATARIIEFPRSAAAPPVPLDELAEPVLARPRILEAPEVVPPSPALGGILIEPPEEPAQEKRPGFEIPLQPAPLSRRLGAAGIDAALVVVALTTFAYLVSRITTAFPLTLHGAGTALIVAGVFWEAYQYLLLVYAGTTPGLKLAKLQLSRFDGSPAPRRIRQWRVLASILSGASLGLGYVWCFLDEDELCWHDRITRTYMAPRK